MIIQSRIQRRGLKIRGSLTAMGMWSAILCGSIAAACSGTIETPTEEFPARQGNSAAADDDDDNAAPAPRPQAPAPSNDDDDDGPAAPPVASNDDDDPLPPAGDDDEEEPAAPPVEEEPAAGALSFEADVQPIFADTCGPCHGAAAQSGVNIGDDDVEAAFDNAVEKEDRVFDRIEAGTMPPGCSGPPGSSGCMTEEDFAVIEAWYEAGTPP